MKKHLPSGSRRPALLFWSLLSLYFLFLLYEVLHSDYLFTDEAYRLWHNADKDAAFADFHTQGRTLGGLMVQFLFRQCHTAAQVRYIRLFSLAECLLLLAVLCNVLKRLQQRMIPAIGDATIYLTLAFVAASLTVSNWIGWAVSTIIFIPSILSLLAGYLLFTRLAGRTLSLPVSLAVVALGVTGLFFYQSPYPFLLLPFYLLFLTRKDGKFDRPVYIGLLFFFIILGIYYGCFTTGLKLTGMEASSRTALATNPLERLSFFFSYPMNQAFNGNFFFDVKSGISQAVFPVLFLAWLVITFRTARASITPAASIVPGVPTPADPSPKSHPGRGRAMIALRYIGGILFFWILGFLPQLVGQEAFGPYRTMLVLGLMVFLALMDAVFVYLRTEKARMYVSFIVILLLLGKGAWNYKTYLADPLRMEYQAIKGAVKDHYTDRIKTVVFVMAPENGFEKRFGIGSYKDEFGMPSTHKDWTPDPLLRQLVYEITGNRQTAAALRVTLVNAVKEAADTTGLRDGTVLLVDAPQLLNDLK